MDFIEQYNKNKEAKNTELIFIETDFNEIAKYIKGVDSEGTWFIGINPEDNEDIKIIYNLIPSTYNNNYITLSHIQKIDEEYFGALGLAIDAVIDYAEKQEYEGVDAIVSEERKSIFTEHKFIEELENKIPGLMQFIILDNMLKEGLFWKARKKPRSFTKELSRKNRLKRKFSRSFGKVLNKTR